MVGWSIEANRDNVMKNLCKLTAGVVLALALVASPAMADGYKKPHAGHPAAAPECAASKFGGFYLGVHGGMGSLTSNFTPEGIISIEKTEDGITFGGQMGYNWVKCHSLFGIEADFAFADFDSNSTILGALFGPGAPTLSRSMDWLGSIRTKSGIALGDVMLYVTGGIAFANIETSLDFGGVNITRVDDTRIGWVAGVGTEYALTDSIRITGDVLYYDFGTENSGLNPALGFPVAVNFEDHHSLWVSRIGLNFKLGDRATAYEPLK